VLPPLQARTGGGDDRRGDPRHGQPAIQLWRPGTIADALAHAETTAERLAEDAGLREWVVERDHRGRARTHVHRQGGSPGLEGRTGEERAPSRKAHGPRMSEVAQRGRDRPVVPLIHRFLTAGAMEHEARQETVEGLPQGGPRSPLLSPRRLDLNTPQAESADGRITTWGQVITPHGSVRTWTTKRDPVGRWIRETVGMPLSATCSRGWRRLTSRMSFPHCMGMALRNGAGTGRGRAVASGAGLITSLRHDACTLCGVSICMPFGKWGSVITPPLRSTLHQDTQSCQQPLPNTRPEGDCQGY
jgi:hypothetical protein